MEAACYGLDARQVRMPGFLKDKENEKGEHGRLFEWTQRIRGGRLRRPFFSYYYSQ